MKPNLSVLHLSASDNFGGSGRSANRVHVGLKRLGVRSRMLVGWKVTKDPQVRLIDGRGWLLNRAIGRTVDRLGLQSLFYPSSMALPLHPWFRQADVVQLYNLHGGFFSPTALPWLSRFRPVVWRLSDMWPLTGHCAYSFACERWKTGCGACPILSDYPSLPWDTTALLWRTKRWVYARSRLTIVSPSRWLASVASASPLLQHYPIHVIPNGLDTTVFRPISRPAAREVLGIDPERQVILFSAKSLADRRKGGTLLREALARLTTHGRANVVLLLVGEEASDWQAPEVFETRRVSHTRSDELLAVIYSAADLFVLPTLADNLPNGVIESMACGTPVVSFNVGGVPDAVRHMDTGYLAVPGDAADLAHGIQVLLEDPQRLRQMQGTCRKVVECEYTLELQAKRFLELYQNLLAQPQQPGPIPSEVRPRRAERRLAVMQSPACSHPLRRLPVAALQLKEAQGWL